MREAINTYNFCAKSIEKTFNKLGTLPFCIPVISGQMRAIAGAVQKAAGLAFLLIGAIGYATASALNSSRQVKNNYKELFLFGAEQVVHGTLNIFRGALEATISLVTLPIFGLGSLALIPINTMQSESYAPIFAYGSFTGRNVVHIPMPYGLQPIAAYY